MYVDLASNATVRCAYVSYKNISSPYHKCTVNIEKQLQDGNQSRRYYGLNYNLPDMKTPRPPIVNVTGTAEALMIYIEEYQTANNWADAVQHKALLYLRYEGVSLAENMLNGDVTEIRSYGTLANLQIQRQERIRSKNCNPAPDYVKMDCVIEYLLRTTYRTCNCTWTTRIEARTNPHIPTMKVPCKTGKERKHSSLTFSTNKAAVAVQTHKCQSCTITGVTTQSPRLDSPIATYHMTTVSK